MVFSVQRLLVNELVLRYKNEKTKSNCLYSSIEEEKLLEYSNMAKGYPGAECTLQEIKNTKNM